MATKKEPETEVKNEFTKEQILSAKKYANYKDLINVLLSDARTYTLVEIDKKIEDFKKGKVE